MSKIDRAGSSDSEKGGGSGISRRLPWGIWTTGVAYGVFAGLRHYEGPTGWIPRCLLWTVDAAVIWYGSRRR